MSEIYNQKFEFRQLSFNTEYMNLSPIAKIKEKHNLGVIFL